MFLAITFPECIDDVGRGGCPCGIESQALITLMGLTVDPERCGGAGRFTTGHVIALPAVSISQSNNSEISIAGLTVTGGQYVSAVRCLDCPDGRGHSATAVGTPLRSIGETYVWGLLFGLVNAMRAWFSVGCRSSWMNFAGRSCCQGVGNNRTGDVMAEYFVKRNDKVHGPFVSSQIQSGIKSKKLSGDDFLSRSENGPWKPLSDYFRKKAAPPAPPEDTDIQPSVAPALGAAVAPEPPVVVEPEPVTADEYEPFAATADEPASLFFIRKTGAMGALTKIKVLVDGEMEAKLAVTQTAEVSVLAGSHDIEVKGGGAFRGAKTTVSIDPGTALGFVVKYSALGGLKLVPAEPPTDSAEGDGLSVTDVANLVDGVSTILGFLDDDE